MARGHKDQHKDINELLSELVRGAPKESAFISSPETIRRLKDKGVKFDPPVDKTPKENIRDLFSERKKIALDNIAKFPTSPPKIAIPTISFLYNEIRECILFGTYGAAISLTSVLVEFALKNAIVREKCGNTYDKTEWDRIENMELGDTISEAKKLHLIDGKMQKKLNSFKNTVRNPYLHYNIKKITKNVVAKGAKKVEIETEQVENVDLPAEDNPVVWCHAKKFVDKEQVFEVFNFADSVVKYLFERK